MAPTSPKSLPVFFLRRARRTCKSRNASCRKASTNLRNSFVLFRNTSTTYDLVRNRAPGQKEFEALTRRTLLHSIFDP
jgi:hypothetical protein